MNSQRDLKARKNFIDSCKWTVKLIFQRLGLSYKQKKKQAQINSQQRKIQYLKRDQVKVSSSPHIEGLTVQDFLNYARQKPQIMIYLPDERDWVHLDRQWISDILYSIDTDEFEEFIKDAITRRQQKYEEQQNLSIQMRPEFVEALKSCKTFSRKNQIFKKSIDEKGRSVFLIKDSSKRKRRRDEIEEVKTEEQFLRNNKQEYLREHKRLKTQNEELEIQIQLLNNTQEIINQLIDSGVINESGNILAHQQFNI